MSAVAVVTHHANQRATELARDLVTWLRADGHTSWATPSSDSGLADLADERPAADADLLVSFGGDGTMLHAVHELDGAPVPVLGVNLGRLGYLTEIEADGGRVREAVTRFLAGAESGRWTIDERMMLDVQAVDADGSHVGTWRALNEGVVEKLLSGHTVHLLVRIDGEPFTSYAADGLIVSTPTGSTAYSLSARGPVVSPKHAALLVTPVAPHMLFDRSLVLDPTESVEIEVLGDRTASVAVDGRPMCRLGEGAVVTCRPSNETARFVRLGDHHYHQVLKAKFGLTDR